MFFFQTISIEKGWFVEESQSVQLVQKKGYTYNGEEYVKVECFPFLENISNRYF